MAFKDYEPLWMLKDVCDAMGVKNSRNVAKRLNKDDVHLMDIVDSAGKRQEAIMINEGALYSVIIRSDKPEARKFERWITHKVLPSIRKFGVYITPEKLSELENNPDALPRLIRKIRKDQVIIETLQEQVEEYTAKVTLANAFLTEGETITIGEFAKILNSNDVNIGQNRLFQMLRDKKFIMKTDSQFNGPTQKASDMKLLRVVRRTVVSESGLENYSSYS